MSFRALSLAKLMSLWIVLALIVGISLSSMNLFQYRRLSDHGVAVTGSVTRLEPRNHQFVGYSYEVSGQAFTGTGNASRGNPNFALLRVGDDVHVWYLPDRPNESCLGNPDSLLKNETTAVLLGAVFAPTFILGALAARKPGFRRWLTR
jgi:Protein of unknown function (DUF3592)